MSEMFTEEFALSLNALFCEKTAFLQESIVTLVDWEVYFIFSTDYREKPKDEKT